MRTSPLKAAAQQPAPANHAALYARMSTNRQEYSIENQIDAILRYAASQKLQVVRTYIDAGRSGVRIDGRTALIQLIQDVVSGAAPFSKILVYDVTRWGRFQNVDESAHYEYLCKQSGVDVCYCAEQFDNSGSLTSNLVKGMKRAMAAEFSRELSVKVLDGQKRLAALGFYHGGVPPYGLRRLLVRHDGVCRQLLARGEEKHLQTDHVVLTHGPADEVELVRRIFRLFVEEKMPRQHIADLLNREGIKNSWGNRWSHNNVLRMLRNEIYVGRIVYNRSTFKLKTARVSNPRDQWVIKDGALDPIVDQDIFLAAQRILRNPWTYSDAELLNQLTCILCVHRRLTTDIVRRTPGPSITTYFERFGGLAKSYHLIGYYGSRNKTFTGDPDFRPQRKAAERNRVALPWKHMTFRYRMPAAGG